METRLTDEQHAQVRSLTLEYSKGDEKTKQVYIRDQLDELLRPYVMRWRLMPKEIGIHPANRDGAAMTAFAAQLRGARILESGFSAQAIGKVWCVEDHPRSRHIEKHTLNVTSSDSAFGSYEAGTVRVGPLNWTHSNQFVAMVMDRAPCDYAALPLRDGKLDSDTILQDPKNTIIK